MIPIVEGAAKLQKAVESNDLSTAKQLLTQLKISMTALPSLSSGAGKTKVGQELLGARSTLEWATILSLKQEDMTAFERHISQLNVYYADYASDLPLSSLRYPILGMRLLHLLVENRMADFHVELESISEEGRKDENIAFAIKLEQYLMEGSYSKVLEFRSKVPNPYCKYFMSRLFDTVRDAIAECMEVAYQGLALDDAKKMLIFDTPKELLAYIKERKSDWTVDGNQLRFKAPKQVLGASDIPSLKLVGETLAYATELDRIV